MTPLRVGLAIAAGLAVSTLPFLRYVHLGHFALPPAYRSREPKAPSGIVTSYVIGRRKGPYSSYPSDEWRLVAVER